MALRPNAASCGNVNLTQGFALVQSSIPPLWKSRRSLEPQRIGWGRMRSCSCCVRWRPAWDYLERGGVLRSRASAAGCLNSGMGEHAALHLEFHAYRRLEARWSGCAAIVKLRSATQQTAWRPRPVLTICVLNEANLCVWQMGPGCRQPSRRRGARTSSLISRQSRNGEPGHLHNATRFTFQINFHPGPRIIARTIGAAVLGSAA